jgi:hypothetical protein
MKAEISYCTTTDDPQATLSQFLEDHPISIKELELLLQTPFGSPMIIPGHPQAEVLGDLSNLTYDKDSTPESIRCKYIYFATALPHLWGIWKKDFFCCPETIVSFAGPNLCVPYILLHAEDGKIRVMKHNFEDLSQPFKALTLVHRGPREPLETNKGAYDFNTKMFIPSSKGVFLQIVIRMDEDTAHIPKSGATNQSNFIVVLTAGKHGILQGVYYNYGTKKQIFELYAICH